MKRIPILVIFALLLMFCSEPPEGVRGLAEFPSYFEDLEADILYVQDDHFVFLNKETQEGSVLNSFTIQERTGDISWLQGGNIFLFTDTPQSFLPADEDNLYCYDLNDATLRNLHLTVSNLYVSPWEDEFIFTQSLNDDYVYEMYLYDLSNDTQHDVVDILAEHFVNDSTYIMYISPLDVIWTEESLFRVNFQTWTTTSDSSTFAIYYFADLKYHGGVLDVVQYHDKRSLPSGTYLSDSLFVFNSSSENGTYLLNVETGDTTVMSSENSNFVKYVPQIQTVLYERRPEGSTFGSDKNLWGYNLQVGSEYNLFPDAMNVFNVSISPSGNQILCAADLWLDGYSLNIWVFNIEGTNHSVLSDPAYYNKSPVFRPSF